jgi:hypothetical protein
MCNAALSLGMFYSWSLLQNPESEFDYFAARGEMEDAGAPFLAR